MAGCLTQSPLNVLGKEGRRSQSCCTCFYNIHTWHSYSYCNITLLQNFNNCARHTCTITDNRHYYGSPPLPPQLLAADVASYAPALLSSDHKLTRVRTTGSGRCTAIRLFRRILKTIITRNNTTSEHEEENGIGTMHVVGEWLVSVAKQKNRSRYQRHAFHSRTYVPVRTRVRTRVRTTTTT